MASLKGDDTLTDVIQNASSDKNGADSDEESTTTDEPRRRGRRTADEDDSNTTVNDPGVEAPGDRGQRRNIHKAVQPSRVLHLRQLPVDVLKYQFEDLMSKYGEVEVSVKVKNKNMALVQMKTIEGAIRAVEGCQTDPPRIGARSFKVGYSKEKELALAHRPKEAEPEGGWVSVARPESRRRMHQQQQQQQGQQQSSSPAGPRSQHANRNSQTGGIITLLPGTQLPIPMMPPGANNMMQQQPLQIFSQPSMQLPTLPPQNFQTMDGMNSALSAGGSSLRGRIDRQDVLLFRSRAEYLAMIGEDIFESRLSLNINQREQSMGRKLYYYHPSSQRSYHHNYDYDAQRSMSSDNFGSRQHDDFSYHDSRSNGDGGGSQRGSSRGRRRRRYEYEDGRGDSHRNENDYRSSEGDYRQSRHHEPSSEDRYSQRRRHYESSSPRSPQHHYDNRDGHDAREVEKDSPLHRSSRSQRNNSEHEDHRHPDSAYEDNSKHSKSESDIYYD